MKLNNTNGKLWGVCAGLEDTTGIDVTIIRLAFVIATLAGFGTPVLIYILLAFLMDETE